MATTNDEPRSLSQIHLSLEEELARCHIPICSPEVGVEYITKALAMTKRRFRFFAAVLFLTAFVLLYISNRVSTWEIEYVSKTLGILGALSILGSFSVFMTRIESDRVYLKYYSGKLPAILQYRIAALGDIMPEAYLMVRYIKATADPILEVHYKDKDGLPIMFIAAIWDGNTVIV